MRVIAIAGVVSGVGIEVGSTIIRYILRLFIGIEVIPCKVVVSCSFGFQARLKRHVGIIFQIDDFAGDTIYDFCGRAIGSSFSKVADGICQVVVRIATLKRHILALQRLWYARHRVIVAKDGTHVERGGCVMAKRSLYLIDIMHYRTYLHEYGIVLEFGIIVIKLDLRICTTIGL